MTDLSPDAQTSYESGISAVDYAEGEIVGLLAIHARLVAALPTNPAYLGGLDLSPDALARRILGALMNAGWQMPVWPIPEPMQETS